MTADNDDVGVVFPLTRGRRSTSATGRSVLADAVREIDPRVAREIALEQDWRRSYIRIFRELTELDLHSPQVATAIARRGLESAHDRFRFVRAGEEATLAEAATSLDARRPLHTVTIEGDTGALESELSVPYRGRRLAGDDLLRQLDHWVSAGVAEPSFAAAIGALMGRPEWLDLRDLTAIVVGAGAEMGPLVPLLRWGAHVIAIDLPSPRIWERLLAEARRSAGRMSLPVDPNAQAAPDSHLAAAAGADVITELPEVHRWVSSLLAAQDGPVTVGNYVYADGPHHLRAAVAIDALMGALCAERPDAAVAFLSTPTDVFAVPAEVVEDSRRRATSAARWHRLARAASGGRLFSPNYPETLKLDNRTVGLCDSLIPVQGPNYALAKRIQRWRAMTALTDGRVVSHNVAPASRTRSVLKNRILAAAYAGASRFGVEIFDPPTSNTLMAAMLIHDLRNPASGQEAIHNPVELFWHGALHGGIWRNPYAPRSALSAAVLVGLPRR